MSVAAIVTVLVSMFVLGLGMILFFNFQHAISDIKNRLEIEVFIKNTASPEEINTLGEEISDMPEVKEVKFVSKEEALERLRESLKGHEDVLEALSGNPLPPSYEITLKDPQRIEEVASRFFDNSVVDHSPGTHDGVKYGGETSERVLKVTTLFLIGGAGFVALLTVASILLISNTIRLSIFARRREIEIMRLVGATASFIRWPFLLEGMFLGIIGAVVAGLGAWQGYSWAVSGVYRSITFMPVVPVYPLAGRLALILVGLGALIGALGSTVSLRRFLRV